MPTVLEFAGIAPPAGAQGRSLGPLLRGEDPGAGFDRDIFSQSGVGGAVIRSGRQKLIWFPERTEFYDLESDPGERRNLAETDKERADAFKKKLFAGLASDEKDPLSEPLPAGGKFAAEMLRDNARQLELYERAPALTGGRRGRR